MRTPGSKKVALVVAVCFMTTAILPTQRLQAGFADDWVGQKSGAAPSVFMGSQKGYLNGGSFSSRWPQSDDHLMNISRPTIKSGCGGIDLFLGSMSFLNVDFLVSKLQRILAAAPAAAFDIALKTLAPQVAGTIKDMEAMVDKLNHLQISDCKAAKALVGVVADPLSPIMKDGVNAELHAARTDFMQTSGVNDLYAAGDAMFKRAVAPTANQTDKDAAKASTTAAYSGCTAEMAVFSDGSVLANIGDKKGLPTDVIDAMRGFIGDAIVEIGADGTPVAKYIAPAESATFDGMIDGKAKPIHENGVAYTDGEIAAMPKANLVIYVQGKLNDIVGSIKARTAHTKDSTDFMEAVPLPIFPALRAAVQTKQESAMVDNLADTTARMFAYQMTLDLIARIDGIHSYSDSVKSAAGSAAGQAREKCNIAFFAQPMAIIEKLRETAKAKRMEAYNGISTSNQAKANVASLVANIEKFDQIAKRETTARFGAGVASRVASYNEYK